MRRVCLFGRGFGVSQTCNVHVVEETHTYGGNIHKSMPRVVFPTHVRNVLAKADSTCVWPLCRPQRQVYLPEVLNSRQLKQILFQS